MRSHAATLRLAVFPRSGIVTDALLVIGGAIFVALAAQISLPLPFTPVPITGQTFAVLLVGASLGAVRGAASMALYVLVGMVGAPVYAAGHSGAEIVMGATGGYLLSYPIAAAVTGMLAEREWDRRFSSAVTAMLTGNVIIYLVGLPWLATVMGAGLEETLELGLYPFVPGDVFKLYLAGALLPAAWRLLERAGARRR
jgi:biotin transport system substrate-specific component